MAVAKKRSAPEAPKLEIIFRYLMLYYSSTEGLRVLIPRKGHRAVLRDIATDAVIPLSEASVRLEIDGQLRRAARTHIRPKGLLVDLRKPLDQQEVKPAAAFLSSAHVNPRLNALVDLAGGELTAYPSEAFPELANKKVEFQFGPINHFKSKITDTTLYTAPLPSGPLCELVVSSERRTLRLDVSKGARFELRNEDETFGPIPDEQQYRNTEFAEILKLLGFSAKIECDTYACGGFFCQDWTR